VFVYWDFLKEKENAYLGSFFLDPEDVKSVSLGAIWNFSKGTGLSLNWYQIVGHKGPVN
jgi:hypothetical protein